MDAGPISGLEQVRTAPAEVGFAVRPAAEGFAVEDAAASRGQLPLWLAGSLDVRRSGSSVLVAIDGADADGVRAMLRRGVTAIRDLIPTDTGTATLVLPATAEQATALTGQPGQALGQIAAVTTTIDASDSPNGHRSMCSSTPASSSRSTIAAPRLS